MTHAGQPIGIDEVGRGSIAGPLCIAAVFLVRPVYGLKDSKVLSATHRNELAHHIKQSSFAGLGWVPADEIDQIGMARALRLGAERAIARLPNTIQKIQPIIIDGSVNLLPHTHASTLVKADQSVDAVMAASIIAKVARDQLMAQYDAVYPNYGFISHKGYGTRQHMEALLVHGGSPLHRFSFEPLASFIRDKSCIYQIPADEKPKK